jgi:hypothetical protein
MTGPADIFLPRGEEGLRKRVVLMNLCASLMAFGIAASGPAYADNPTDQLPEAVALCLGNEARSAEALQQDLRDIGWTVAAPPQLLRLAEGIAVRRQLVRLDPEPQTSDQLDRAMQFLKTLAVDGTPALEKADGLVSLAQEERVEEGRRRECNIVGPSTSVVPDILTFYDDLAEMTFDPGFESYSATHYRFRNEGRVILAILLRPDPVVFNASNPNRPGVEWVIYLNSLVPCEACE